MIRLTSILLICGAPLVPALASAQGAAEAKKPARTVYQRLKPCRVEGIEREVLCGTLAARGVGGGGRPAPAERHERRDPRRRPQPRRPRPPRLLRKADHRLRGQRRPLRPRHLVRQGDEAAGVPAQRRTAAGGRGLGGSPSATWPSHASARRGSLPELPGCPGWRPPSSRERARNAPVVLCRQRLPLGAAEEEPDGAIHRLGQLGNLHQEALSTWSSDSPI